MTNKTRKYRSKKGGGPGLSKPQISQQNETKKIKKTRFAENPISDIRSFSTFNDENDSQKFKESLPEDSLRKLLENEANEINESIINDPKKGLGYMIDPKHYVKRKMKEYEDNKINEKKEIDTFIIEQKKHKNTKQNKFAPLTRDEQLALDMKEYINEKKKAEQKLNELHNTNKIGGKKSNISKKKYSRKGKLRKKHKKNKSNRIKK